jgi:hypothetical protein
VLLNGAVLGQLILAGVCTEIGVLLLLDGIRRMVVNNDFEVQFNETKRLKAGMSLPPYRYNVTAKPRCGYCHSELEP